MAVERKLWLGSQSNPVHPKVRDLRRNGPPDACRRVTAAHRCELGRFLSAKQYLLGLRVSLASKLRRLRRLRHSILILSGRLIPYGYPLAASHGWPHPRLRRQRAAPAWYANHIIVSPFKHLNGEIQQT